MAKSVLIIDDEESIRTVLRDILEDEDYTVFTAEDGFTGLSILERETINLVYLDVWLPNMGGIEVLEKIKEMPIQVEVVVISGHANIDLAVKAVKLGAFDFLEKPLSLERVITVTYNALRLESLERENLQLKNSLLQNDEMIGESEGIKKIQERISQAAPTDSRVLILGGNGTGKELVARQIHNKSERAKGPFVEVNCAAIPDTLIESELFGHEKGAFTGAVSSRRGKFEVSHGGTLFLDEIADMSLSAQAKVLRVIQELQFERIGSEKTLSVDVRIIAATNKDIQNEIAEGRFREDLYFRLNVIPIHVPSLKERIEDLPGLTEYFLQKFNNNENNEKREISKEGMEILESYSWPGNIRELKNFIERISIMSDEQIVSAETIRFYLGEKRERKKEEPVDKYLSMPLNDAKDMFEKEFISRKLLENNSNISKTAAALGIYPSNLHGKIKKFNIKVEK